MPRYKLTLEYSGAPFCGWQRQNNGVSVQQVLETAAVALSGGPVASVGAGRTDAGVHASAQVAHLDLPRDYAADTVRDALNAHMRPHPVAVIAAEAVADDFHARFSALGRSYVYRILNRRAPPVLTRGQVWWVSRPLDLAAMRAGARHLVGHHDFTSFRASECQSASPLKTLDHLDVTAVGAEIHVATAARSFLHHQVRNIVGTLRLVGSGQWSADDVARALAARDRRAAGPTAPACGLCFTGVTYP